MLKRLAFYWRSIIVGMVTCTLLLCAVPVRAQNIPADTIKAERQADMNKEIFTSSTTPDGKVAIFVEKDKYIIRETIPEQIEFASVVASLTPGVNIELNEIVVNDKSGKVKIKINPKLKLKNSGDKSLTTKELNDILINPDKYEKLKSLLQEATYLAKITVPIKDLNVKKGEKFTLSVTAVFKIEEVEQTATVESNVVVTSLPSRTGWYCGDGHMHTSNYSDDGSYTMSNLVQMFKDMGYKWTIITDHRDTMESKGGTSFLRCKHFLTSV